MKRRKVYLANISDKNYHALRVKKITLRKDLILVVILRNGASYG